MISMGNFGGHSSLFSVQCLLNFVCRSIGRQQHVPRLAVTERHTGVLGARYVRQLRLLPGPKNLNMQGNWHYGHADVSLRHRF